MKNKLKKYWFIIAVILLFVLKLFIVHVQPIMFKGTVHDDGMFVLESISMIKDRWLGEYDNITLCKGITGILFIVFAYKIGISYLLAEQILYFLGCVSVIYTLRHVITKKWVLLLCYVILLFNPISYSDAFSFVYRDGVYTCLILFLFSFSLNLFFNYKNTFLKLIISSCLFGLVISAIYLCREETFILIPYLIVASIIILSFIIFDKDCKNKVKRILCIFGIPIVIFTISIISLCSYNYKYYGRFIINDYTSKEFKDVYGALTRIKQDNYIKRVPLNEETRNKLYELSPKFALLKQYLDNDPGVQIRKKNIVKDGKIYRDYKEGYLAWSLRESVYKLGYYEDAQMAKQYYIDLANEINALCDSNVLECYPKRSSLIAPFQPVLIEEIVKYVPKAFKVQITYENVLVEIPHKDNAYVTLHEYITNNKSYYDGDYYFELSLMKNILKVYQLINPIIMVISIICYVIIMFKFFIKKERFKNYKQVIILNALLYLFLSRNLVVGLVASMEYESAVAKCQYLASSYPVQTIFSVLAIIFLVQNFKKGNRIDECK